MKKILTFCLFITLAWSAQAQVSNLKLGIQASPTFSWMTTNNNNITSDGTVAGFNLGITGQYYFSENYSLVSGISLLLNQGGGLKYDYAGNFLEKAAEDRATTPTVTQLDSISTGSTIKFKAQYIEIPFSIRLRTNEFGYLRYFAELPMFTLAFNTQGRGDISGGNVVSENENISDDIVPIAFRWGLGAGVEYSISENLSLVGGVYYNSTLTDVVRDGVIFGAAGASNTEEDSKATTQSITIRIGVVF
ncbi:MAG: porin family protein [Saprospiraceae bacterium]